MPISKLLRCALAATCLGAVPSVAAAQSATASRVWVSVQGADAAGCAAATNPCRSFQYALGIVAPAGEIDVATPGGYGPMNITQAVTINAGSATPATISGSATNLVGISISAGPNDQVYINGLTIDGANQSGQSGIAFVAGGALTVTNCTIRNFSQSGISFGSSSPSSTLNISDTVLSDNGRFGLSVTPTVTAKNITGIIQGLTANNNQVGVDLDLSGVTEATGLTGNFSISSSVFSNSRQSGIYVFQNSSTINLAIDTNKFVGNGFGMSGFAIDDQSISQFASFGRNYFFRNRANISGSAPTAGTVM